MSKPTPTLTPGSAIFTWNQETQRYTPETIDLVSDGYATTVLGDMIDFVDVYPLDAIYTYDVIFDGNETVFTLYAQDITEAVKLARFQLQSAAGQMSMFLVEVDEVKEMRLY